MSIDRLKLRRMVLQEMHQTGVMMMDQSGHIFDNNGAEQESGMIRSNLATLGQKSQEIHDMIGEHDDLPEWVQEKIAVAESMISSVHDYLNYEYGKFSGPPNPRQRDEEAFVIPLNEAKKKKNGRVKSRKYHGKEYKATSALLKAIKKGASYEELRDMADWADNPDAVVNAALIVAKGHPSRSED